MVVLVLLGDHINELVWVTSVCWVTQSQCRSHNWGGQILIDPIFIQFERHSHHHFGGGGHGHGCGGSRGSCLSSLSLYLSSPFPPHKQWLAAVVLGAALGGCDCCRCRLTLWHCG